MCIGNKSSWRLLLGEAATTPVRQLKSYCMFFFDLSQAMFPKAPCSFIVDIWVFKALPHHSFVNYVDSIQLMWEPAY